MVTGVPGSGWDVGRAAVSPLKRSAVRAHMVTCTARVFSILSPPVLQLIVKRRAGGHATSLKKSNLREDPIPPLPFAL